MKQILIDYLCRFGCDCKTSPNGKFIIARRETSTGVYYHSFEVPRSMPEFCCLTSRCFPEFLGLRPRWFLDVGSVISFLSTA